MVSFFQDPTLMLLVSLVVVVGSIVWLRTGAFFALLLGGLTVSFWSALAQGEAVNAANVVTKVSQAFGTTAGNIGLLIVFGTTIGKCMADNGSSDRIILACRRFFGEKRVPAALAGGAFVLSIPVFYDATFYLLLPLAKSIYRSVKKNYVLYLLCVGLGATISHTVIPPTPGPIAVAETLGVPLATSLCIGLAVGVCLFPVTLLIAWFLNRRLPNPKIDPSALELDNIETPSEMARASNALDEATLPPLSVSLAPIVLPVIFIAGASVLKTLFAASESVAPIPGWLQTLFFLGDPNVALGIAALIACLTTLFSKARPVARSGLERMLNAAVSNAGTIILITAAGGAYGATLRASGIGERIQELFSAMGGLSGATALTLAFLSTALLKTAQGSSTTAMITSASIFASMEFTSETLGCSLGYLGAAIGVGSSVASWMNDSGFCIFSRSSGIAEIDCLKTWTVGTGLLGCCGWVVVLILSQFLPMV
ncbi:MAG: GntP family permease [Thermoguttaceae bacterium]|jgi:GntP family gluconate:H+ symporter